MKPVFLQTLILFTLLAACSAPAEKPKTRALDCYVRFLEQEGQIRAEATLTENAAGETPLPVEIPGGIRYQNTPMKMLPVQGISYRLDYAAAYLPQHTFAWSLADNALSTFTMHLAPLSDFGFGAKTLRRDKPARFEWAGEPLQKGETLVFIWESLDRNDTKTMEIYTSNAQNDIEFPAAKIAELPPGRWSLYLVRKKLTRETVNGVDVGGIVEFYSKTDTLAVQ